jgi:hypothetical protein
MENFRRLASLSAEEFTVLTSKAPTVAAPHGIGVGPDAAEFETVSSDPGATARAIITAAKTRDAGGPTACKPSTVAQQILDAGAKRRGESNG